MNDNIFFDLIDRLRPHIETTETICGCVDIFLQVLSSVKGDFRWLHGNGFREMILGD
jgi:hypothetical protein